MEPDAGQSDADVIGRLSDVLSGGDGVSDSSPEKRKVATATDVIDESEDTIEAGAVDDDVDADGEEEEGEESAAQIETLDDLAESYGLKPEEFLAEISLTEADGTRIPLADVVRNFREARANGSLFDQVAAKQAELSQRERQLSEETAREHGELKKLTGELLKQLKADDEIDWKELEETDPTRFVLERQKHLERMQAADRAVRALEEQGARRAAEAAQARERWHEGERAKLLAAVPEWRDPKVFTEAVSTVSTYLTDAGFDPQEPGISDMVLDHRVMRTLWKAAQYDALSKKGALEGKKLEKLPRVLRGVRRGEEQGPQSRKLSQLRAQQRKRGDRDSTIALLTEMGVQ